MSRTVSLRWLVFAAGVAAAGPAMAQMGCPPGQTFIPTLNRCIATGGGPNCPAGTRYDADLRRCLGTPQPACPDGQSFDPQQRKCAAPPVGNQPSA